MNQDHQMLGEKTGKLLKESDTPQYCGGMRNIGIVVCVTAVIVVGCSTSQQEAADKRAAVDSESTAAESAVGHKQHNNDFTFNSEDGISSLKWEWEGGSSGKGINAGYDVEDWVADANYSVTKGQKDVWGGVTASKKSSGDLKITAKSGRDQTDIPYKWQRHMMSAGEYMGSVANFAFTGRLTPNDADAYEVILTQYFSGDWHNVWEVNGVGKGWTWTKKDISSKIDCTSSDKVGNWGCLVTPDGKYVINGSGVDNWNVYKK